jgi:hypothetical protein
MLRPPPMRRPIRPPAPFPSRPLPPPAPGPKHQLQLHPPPLPSFHRTRDIDRSRRTVASFAPTNLRCPHNSLPHQDLRVAGELVRDPPDSQSIQFATRPIALDPSTRHSILRTRHSILRTRLCPANTKPRSFEHSSNPVGLGSHPIELDSALRDAQPSCLSRRRVLTPFGRRGGVPDSSVLCPIAGATAISCGPGNSNAAHKRKATARCRLARASIGRFAPPLLRTHATSARLCHAPVKLGHLSPSWGATATTRARFDLPSYLFTGAARTSCPGSPSETREASLRSTTPRTVTHRPWPKLPKVTHRPSEFL